MSDNHDFSYKTKAKNMTFQTCVYYVFLFLGVQLTPFGQAGRFFDWNMAPVSLEVYMIKGETGEIMGEFP